MEIMGEDKKTLEIPCETPLTESLAGISKDARIVEEIQRAEDGTPTRHSQIPVGGLMHKAADEIGRLQEELDELQIEAIKKERDRLLVLAAKHCPNDHHDWNELLTIAKALKGG